MKWPCLLPLFATAVSAVLGTWTCAQESGKTTFAKDVAPFLGKFCTSCHGGARPKAGFALDVLKTDGDAARNPKLWQKVLDMLNSGEMPPAGRPKPSVAESDRLANWITTVMLKVDCTKERDPGRVTLRRLNRTEYKNTIRDLLGVDFTPTDDFPADDVGYGFDNIGDVLTLSPLLMEKYLSAAEKIAALALSNPQTRGRILFKMPEANNKQETARQIIDKVVRRAYRRPALPEEVERLQRFVDLAEKNGDNFEKGIQLVVQATLVSPHFLFRVERGSRKNFDPKQNIVPLTDNQLATRLSYFLWSSMPDDELFALADKGTLREPAVVEQQVRRMLQDTKARALTENFAGQWLQFRSLRTLTPDKEHFPAFDEPLRRAMIRETELFFETMVREDRSILEFLDADFTFVNERLAKHYGIANIKGADFQKVSLAGTQRRGVLAQASVLTVTSNPSRTSPVKRGKWILENIFNAPPPPPPPDVPELEDGKTLKGSLRQRMEQHRVNALCASCHQRLDPLGFGFENFDGIGAWRDKEGSFPVDASGTLPSGETFKGPLELVAILKTKTVDFRRCLAEKMLIYSIGRGLETFDKCAVDDICSEVARRDHRFSALVLAIVSSDPFQKRKIR